MGSDTTLLGGLVAAASLFAVNALFKECLYRIPGFGRIMQGESLMLVYHGKVNDANMSPAKHIRAADTAMTHTGMSPEGSPWKMVEKSAKT